VQCLICIPYYSHNICQYLVRSARHVLVRTYEALAAELKLGKAADPDRQKGTEANPLSD